MGIHIHFSLNRPSRGRAERPAPAAPKDIPALLAAMTPLESVILPGQLSTRKSTHE